MCASFSAHRFITKMFRMHETQNMEAGDLLRPTDGATVDLNKLRSALDICLEKLPPMLELGHVPQLLTQEYNFPYHRPSIISMSSAASDLMPESIGYVLLQVSSAPGSSALVTHFIWTVPVRDCVISTGGSVDEESSVLKGRW